MPAMGRKIGVFGGSFDPPHNGHLICAKAAADRLGFEKILVIPSAQQPLKPKGARASAEDRLRMVAATFGGDPIFEVSTIELDRGGISYSVETLLELRLLYPAPEFSLVLLVGADALADIPNWSKPDQIFRIAKVASMLRRGAVAPEFPAEWTVQVIELDTPHIDISSREIRARIAAGKSIAGLVPEEVGRIIKANSLYVVQESASIISPQ